MRTDEMLARVWYPAIMVAAVGTHAAAIAAGVPAAAAVHGPVVAAALAAVALELRFPEHAHWRPARAEVGTDAAFMALVQVLLPQLLAGTAVLLIASHAHDATAAGTWPHEWPVPLQVLVMILVVDLMRYWLHRACHRYDLLWRLHAVHHAPERLYTLNVGRFHPLEKALHFAVDTAPFLLLGVAPEVLAGYFLVYSVNGFCQHSNARLRYGLLNYVVGSAETHRWHHARDPRAADCNYGSTTAVWDLLFGTWRLPAGRGVEDVGIPDPDYPRGFLALLAAPFARRRGATTGSPR